MSEGSTHPPPTSLLPAPSPAIALVRLPAPPTLRLESRPPPALSRVLFINRRKATQSHQIGERGFTIVEVMMASVILVVGFIGMISALTVGSEMLATAQRQNLAAQIINHEFEKLRLSSWSTFSAPLTNISTTDYTALTPNDSQFNAAIAASGVTFNLARTVTNVTTDLYEITLTVTWTKNGTQAAASGANTNAYQSLDQLAFLRTSPISRTYTRTATAYFGKYGLNNSYQRL